MKLIHHKEKENLFFFFQDITDTSFHVDQKHTPVGNVFYLNDQNLTSQLRQILFLQERKLWCGLLYRNKN